MGSDKSSLVMASDGLIARNSGSWGKQKLSFIDDFGPPALEATQRKIDRFYLDLFAGPGRNRNGEGGEEFAGSPLRALPMTASDKPAIHFTDAILVNADPAQQAALERRVERLYADGVARMPRTRVRFELGDANYLLPNLLRRIPKPAYVFTFVDIEGIEDWPWSSVETLTNRGHSSVDLYMLFPMGMAIQRLISWRQTATDRYDRVLTAFFGAAAWKDLVAKRQTNAQSRMLRRGLEDLYVGRLRERWKKVFVVREIKSRGRPLYKMIYATNHPAGEHIAAWAKAQEEQRKQGSLF